MKRAVMFPGQGAQHVGMGKEFFESNARAKEIFERANDALGIDLAQICFEGPDTELNRTDVCQPAILTTGIAILSAMCDDLDQLASQFQATAGLSLGEYTALVFAGSLSFDDAVRLVRKRGQYMQECSDAKPSGMVSLIGADEAKAAELCDQIRGDDIASVANLNGGGQVVISGDIPAMERAVEAASGLGIRRAVSLKVAGAFHSELMRGAADRLVADLADVTIERPKIPFLSNVTGDFVTEPEDIRRYLGEQVCSPVRWEPSMQKMLADGIDHFVEPGPGKVLCALARKIDREATTVSVTVPEEGPALLEHLSATGDATS